jgi:hypothetical protein
MNYFTPELYLRSNSPDYREVEQAAKEWAGATAAYRGYLEKVIGLMDASLRTYVTNTSPHFHDAEVLLRKEVVSERTTWSASYPEDHPRDRRVRFFLLSLRTDDSLINVTYVLRRPASRFEHKSRDVFSGERRCWLYDEVLFDPHWVEMTRTLGVPHGESPPKPDFLHCVLFSDGAEFYLPFTDVLVSGLPLASICGDVPQAADTAGLG